MKKNIFKGMMVAAVISVLAIGCAKEEGDNSIVTLPRDKFIGTWTVNSHGTVSGDLTWDMIIEAGPADEPSKVVLKNFDETGNDKSVNALVSGSALTIPDTTIGSVTVQGTGSINGATLTLDYTSTDSQTDVVHATAHK